MPLRYSQHSAYDVVSILPFVAGVVCLTDLTRYGAAYLLTTTALQPTFGRIYTIFDVSVDSVQRDIPILIDTRLN